MAVTEQGPGGRSWLLQRVKNILFTPAEEWDRIDAEPATVKGLYVGYACILAAIGPIAKLISGQLFGFHTMFGIGRPGLIGAIVATVVAYLANLAGIYVLALVIDALAPSFGGTKDRLKALKIAVYSATAAWIFAVFQLVPQVSALSIIGVYSLYLLYLGIPKLMKTPTDKAAVYSVVAIVVALAIWIVIALASSMLTGSGPAAASI